MADRQASRTGGFTLIELILVIVLLGILSAVLVVFIVQPFAAAGDIQRRADLVDSADLALESIGREVRNALPNSVRVHAPGHLELITTVTGGRYRRLPEPGGGGDILVPARGSDSFDVLGGLSAAGQVLARAPGTDCGSGSGHCLSVYNTGQPGFDAYAGENIAAITAVSGGSLSYDRGDSTPAFAAHSAHQRFFVVDTVVSYICRNGQLRRYSAYGLGSGPPDPSGGELVATDLAACQFSYTPGTASRRGLLSARLDLARDGESVFLLAQYQVLNTP